MIKYRIHKPFDQMCQGPYPKEQAWHDIGLGHLLPIKVTGIEWPVVPFNGGFVLGQGITECRWHRVSQELEIGLVDGNIPTPEHFAKPKLLPGVAIADSSGAEWIVPAGNPESVVCSLPRQIRWTGNGPAMQLDPDYANIAAMCGDMFNYVLETETIDHVWAATQALRILQLNYRIGAVELAAFQSCGINVIDKATATKIVLWFIDHDLVEEVLKKK
jgi:hypothetical protein